MSANETSAGGACEQMLLHMSCALDGSLADHEMAELSAHLADCASCRARAQELSIADELFRDMEKKHAAPPDAAFTRQVMERVRLEAASAGSVRAFSRLVAQDADLQNQIRPAADMDAFVELFIALGRQHGYRFGKGEVVSLLAARPAANDDLSDEQLDAMVGGVMDADAALHAFLGDVLGNWLKPPAK